MSYKEDLTKMKKNIDDFIKEHSYISYCEAVIFTDGTISYVNPSHVETMIEASGKTREEIYSLIDIFDSPLHWLVDYTNCICIWSGGYLKSNISTSEQVNSLEKLIEVNLVANNNYGGVPCETI